MASQTIDEVHTYISSIDVEHFIFFFENMKKKNQSSEFSNSSNQKNRLRVATRTMFARCLGHRPNESIIA